MGLQPLAPLRRAAPVPRARTSTRAGSGDSSATTATRSPGSPRATAGEPAAPGRAPGRRARRCQPRRSRPDSAPRACASYPGPHRAARLLPLAAPVRDPPSPRRRDLRGGRRDFRDPAPARVSPLRSAALTGVARDRQGAVIADAARPGRRGRGGPATTAAQGRSCCAASSRSCRAGSARPATTARRPTHQGTLRAKPRDYASNPQISRTARGLPSRPTARSSPLLKRGEIAVETRGVGDGPRCGRPAALPHGPAVRSSYNATISGDGAGRVRVGGRQPQLRQAVRRYRRLRARSVDGAGVAEPAGTAEGVRRVAIGVGPGAVGRWQARRLPGRRRRRAGARARRRPHQRQRAHRSSGRPPA